MKKFLMAMIALFAITAVPASQAAEYGKFILYFGPGAATNINQDIVQNEDRDVFVMDLGFLYNISNVVGLGLETSHNSEDWSVNRTQLVAVFDLAPSTEKSFATYLKLSGGAVTWDTEDSDIGPEFLWNLEPSFGVTWRPSVDSSFRVFASTGPSIVFQADQDALAALQTRAGLAIELGN